MTCYYPLTGYRQDSGKLNFMPSLRVRQGCMPLTVSCGQCIGCRLERSRQWAVRCMHEASLYDDNCFITLTFSPEHCPEDMSLDHTVFQNFMKRFRKRFGEGIRYYMCGEYGEKFGRPHYHACIFNFDFADKQLFKVVNGHRLYISPALSELWPFGYSTIGSVTFESAAYVARYIMKKVTGDAAQRHYLHFDRETGEIFGCRKPEYNQPSRRPGIGRGWIEKFHSEVYPSDEVIVNGFPARPPRYYDGVYEALFPFEMEPIKFQRHCDALLHLDDNTPERLKVRERVKLAKIGLLKRNLEDS